MTPIQGREQQADSMTAQHQAQLKNHQHNSANIFALHGAAATNEKSPRDAWNWCSGNDSSSHMHGLLHMPLKTVE